jgi:UDP-N-acetyl-D-glucosamine dehydrogenase
MPAYVVRRLIQALNDREQPVRGRRVLLLGLAYKPNTGDARESPAVAVAERLAGLGAEVRAVDPHVDDDCIAPVIARAALTADEVAAADAVVLLTHHDDFDLDLVVRHARYVLDTRHCMAGAQVEHL